MLEVWLSWESLRACRWAAFLYWLRVFPMLPLPKLRMRFGERAPPLPLLILSHALDICLMENSCQASTVGCLLICILTRWKRSLPVRRKEFVCILVIMSIACLRVHFIPTKSVPDGVENQRGCAECFAPCASQNVKRFLTAIEKKWKETTHHQLSLAISRSNTCNSREGEN